MVLGLIHITMYAAPGCSTNTTFTAIIPSLFLSNQRIRAEFILK